MKDVLTFMKKIAPDAVEVNLPFVTAVWNVPKIEETSNDETNVTWDTWQPNECEKKAAWELYIELTTRITTQPLKDEDGLEKAALKGLHSLFATTRDILKNNGAMTANFSVIAIAVLNDVIRPFTAKWHGKETMLDNNKTSEMGREFRHELRTLQITLQEYATVLLKITGIEIQKDN